MPDTAAPVDEDQPAFAATLLDQQIQTGDDVTWRRTLARVQARAGNLPAARTQVERVLSGAPLDEEMLALRSVLDAADGHADTALRSLEEATQRLPKGPLLAELRTELQAAGQDKTKIHAVVARSLAAELGPPPAPAARVRAESDVLDKAQVKRLRQLERQRVGAALFNEVEVLDALKLTPEQAEALEAKARELTPKGNPFAEPGRPPALACRIYPGPSDPAGLPPAEELRAALVAAASTTQHRTGR